MTKETKRFACLWLATLLVLLIVIGMGIRCNRAEVDGPGEPLCRITYYLTEDGTVCTVLENLSDHDLTITFPEGVLPPPAEIGGNDGAEY